MTAPFVLLYDNFADRGIFSGGSWVTDLPQSNMQDPDVQKVARTTDAQANSTMFKINLGRTQDVDGVAFGPINISPGATWQFKGYGDADYTDEQYNSGVQTVLGDTIDWTDTNEWFEWEDTRFWYGVATEQDNLPQYLYHVTDVAQSIQYWKLQIFDATNPDGYIQIGRLLIARAFRPSRNYVEGAELSVEALTDMVESFGGKRDYWERGFRRKATYTFDQLEQSEIFSDVFRASLKSGISRQMFVVPSTNDTLYGSRRSFLATFAAAPVMRQLLVARGSVALNFEEVL